MQSGHGPVCSGLFDRFHTTGAPDLVQVTPAEVAMTADEFVRSWLGVDR
jgi:hypothetical protein